LASWTWTMPKRSRRNSRISRRRAARSATGATSRRSPGILTVRIRSRSARSHSGPSGPPAIQTS
jgi:hypothetical protein